MNNVARRILLVEDEPEIREIVRELIESDYSEIDEAADGAAGLELISKNRYALVLSDIKMPKMTGIEMFANTKAMGSLVPFVFLTAYGDQDNITKALRLGAFDFIQKPFEDDEVLKVVNRAAEVGYRRLLLAESLSSEDSVSSEKIKKEEKMIQLLELKNFKRRA